MAGFEHVAMSDPQKVARLVLTVAELNEPPLRFSPAAMPTNTAARPAASDRDRREMGSTSGSTDHDDAGDQWQHQRGSSRPTCERDR